MLTFVAVHDLSHKCMNCLYPTTNKLTFKMLVKLFGALLDISFFSKPSRSAPYIVNE